ncbi:MAG: hypothetical protein ABIJ56_10225 [Pseudomonadota bacterium]
MNDQSRPGWWPYIVAALMPVAGGVLFIVILVTGILSTGRNFSRVIVPGRGDIDLKDDGKYSIFHEHHSVIGDRVFSAEKGVPGLDVSLYSKETGLPVPLEKPVASHTYSTGAHSGVAVFKFHIVQPGTYTLVASYPEGVSGSETVLAVGKGFAGRIVMIVLGSQATIFGSLGLGVLIALFTFVRRSKRP